MKFDLDTNDYENIHLTFTDDDYESALSDLIQEFCFAMSSFFIDFAMKLDCDGKKAKGLKKVILDCVESNIDLLLEEGLLDTHEDN